MRGQQTAPLGTPAFHAHATTVTMVKVHAPRVQTAQQTAHIPATPQPIHVHGYAMMVITTITVRAHYANRGTIVRAV